MFDEPPPILLHLLVRLRTREFAVMVSRFRDRFSRARKIAGTQLTNLGVVLRVILRPNALPTSRCGGVRMFGKVE